MVNEDKITLQQAMERLWKKEDMPNVDTEDGIWQVIEVLGGIIWRNEHDSADGRITLTEKDLTFMTAGRFVQRKLVEKLKNKYNVIPPDECPQREFGKKVPPAPKGKMYYWDWYDAMNKEYFTNEYKNMICYGCALHESEPVERLRGHIPCSVFPGVMYQLSSPIQCGMTDKRFSGFWTEQELLSKIKEVGGEDSVKRFKQHQFNLRSQACKKTN